MIDALGLLTRFHRTLASRTDSEHVQALLRMLMSFPHLLYVLGVYYYASPTGSFDLATLILISSSLLITGMIFLIHIALYPDTNNIRRWIGILTDMFIIGLTIYSLGDSGSPVFGMYIWVVIGNGFRYGIRFLYGATASALLSFYIVAYLSPHYSSDIGLLILASFLLGIVIPIYIGGLLKQLQQNLEAAREADRLKTRFLSNVSHDLRTPLNAIMANCELLDREPGNNALQSRRLHDMQKAATTLNGLLVDLLDVARIEAGRIKIMSSSFNVIELLGRVQRFNHSAAQSNGTNIYLSIAPETPAQVFGDTLRLEQILNNIVSNAVKYTENGEVAIFAAPLVDHVTGSCKGITCSVSDTGIGMEPEELGRVFSRFEQADQTYSRRYSGAGLGLNIANELTALMGGSIDVTSTKGKGSCFTIKVPLRSDTAFKQDTVANFLKTPITVICANIERKKYWKQLFDGKTRPSIPIVTAQELTRPIELPEVISSNPRILIVDASMFDIDIEEIATMVNEFCKNPISPRVLVNTPGFYEAPTETSSVARFYRCWTNRDALEDIEKALEIAYWTIGSETLSTENEGELQSWMSALEGLNILVADDNELNRNVLSDMLVSAGAVAVKARNGADALAILSKQTIDIALLDIQMPELTGLEVMRAQVEQSPDRTVPMIALTADTTEECHAQCLKSGAKSILHKPVDMKTLYRELYKILTGRKATFPDRRRRYSSEYKEDAGLIDYSLLQELVDTGRQPDYVAKLVACFKQEGQQLLLKLRHTFRLDNIEDSRNLLHRLKGMSGSIGASQMAAICEEYLMLPDEELRASAQNIIAMLLQKHTDSALLLDAFSESSESSHPCFIPTSV